MSRPQLPSDCVPPAPRQELRVRSADGTRLHVEVHGAEDAPTVVLAHGWTCRTAFWAPVIRLLSADHRLVAYDQRGHGRSEIPARPPAAPARARRTARTLGRHPGYSTDALADDLEAVLQATVPSGSRAVLAGHSMGGMTIMAAADRAEVRSRTAATLLASTGSSGLTAALDILPFAGHAPRARLAAHRALMAARTPLGPVTPLSRAVLKYATMGPATPAERVEACARLVHACPRAVRAEWARVLGELDLDANVGRLTAPTAVIVGSADRLTPPVLARSIHAALPHSEGLTELPGIGHMSPVERPDVVADAIRRLAAAHLAAERPAAAHPTADPALVAPPVTGESPGLPESRIPSVPEQLPPEQLPVPQQRSADA